VEDYSVNINASAGDTQAPTAPTNLAASGVTQTSANLSWTVSTDNVGVTGYDVLVNNVLNGSTATASYALTGLTAATSYNVAVRAKDAAGNLSALATITVVTQSPSCSNVTLTLKLDNYPEETSWIIKNASGTTVASGGTYGSSPDGSTITSVNCLPAGCYTFTINDAYGDGICCAYGNGSYTLKDAAGTTLASGASFTTSASHNFCLGTSKITDRGIENVFAEGGEPIVYPNPAKTQLTVRVPGAVIRHIDIITVSGVVKRSLASDGESVDVSNLQSGMYILSLKTDKGIAIKKFVKE
jgi:hypothetical protein